MSGWAWRRPRASDARPRRARRLDWAISQAGLHIEELSASDLAPADDGVFARSQREAFRVVRDFLAGEMNAADARGQLAPACGLHARLVDAVEGLGTGYGGAADLAALLGSVLRREGALARPGEPRARLAVMLSYGEGLRGVLASAELEGVPVGRSISVTARRWRPEWLDAEPLESVDAVEPRHTRLVHPRADRFFNGALGYRFYASEGQQVATRCVELSPDGSTVLVSLPTGTGKSAVGLYTSLRSGATGTTVVVVPTISLARDQQRHFRDALDRGEVGRVLAHRDFAYLGDGDETAKAEIRARIEEGRQGLLFLAPESFRGLLPTLRNAAQQGLLTDFVVDEAHTVMGWGVDFRPDFQTISGARRGLLEACPESRRFRTILLSATITEHAATLLMRLFGPDGDADESVGFKYLAVEGALRPEPSYFVADCIDEDERTDRVLEAVGVLPRPAIVYVTNPAHAQRLVDAMGQAGFSRVATYTGATKPGERERVERGWRGGQDRTLYDVVVATSAFGLGIDQHDVRAVIHAYTPETTSRFYQEVGRGGRDGRACLSLLLTNRRDVHQCRRLALAVYPRKVVRSRWDSMFHHRGRIEADERVWVDLDDVRPELRVRGVIPGEPKNRGWNQRTLTLLQDAGLIRLDTPSATISPPGFGAPVGVRVVRSDMYEPAWDQAWEAARRRGLAETEADFTSMQTIIVSHDCIAGQISQRFTLELDGQRFSPAAACGGCPSCRRHGRPPWADRVWVRASARTPVQRSETALSALLEVAPLGIVAVAADSAQKNAVIVGAINLCATRGTVLAASPQDLTAAAVDDRRRRRPGLADEDGRTRWLSIPGVVEVLVAPDDEQAPWILEREKAVLRILVVSRETSSPKDPHRSIMEMRPVPVLFADQFLSLLS
jgi:ATP-dependent DNA helicase RecQ